jgi:hypothetical protein
VSSEHSNWPTKLRLEILLPWGFLFWLLVKFALVLIQEGFRSVGLLSALNCLAKLGVKEWGAMLRSTTDSVSTSDSFSVSHMHLDFMLTVFRKWSDKFSLIFIGSVAVFLIDSSILIGYGMFLILFLASLFQHIAAGVAFNFGFGYRVAPADIFNSAGVCDYSSASLSESMVFPFR